MKKCMLITGICLAFAACTSDAVFERYAEVPGEVWSRYHVVELEASIPDSGLYEVTLCVRHTTDYEMANLWCFVSTRSHAPVQLHDTVNMKIAEPDGRWIGEGRATRVVEQPINKNPVALPKGTVLFRIEQGMRFEEMAGVKSVGIRVERLEEGYEEEEMTE